VLDLLRTLKTGRTWDATATALGNIYSGAFLRLVLRGERHAPLDLVNAVRVHFDLESLTETPAQTVAASGVDRVVQLSRRPNTAILAAVSGDVCRVTIRTGELADGDSPSVSITLGYVPPKRRRARYGRGILLLSEMDAQGPETIRGKSGDLTRISDAVQHARAALDYVPTASECAAWLAALNQMEVM